MMTINCQNQNPVVLEWDAEIEEWVLTPISEYAEPSPPKDGVPFQYTSTTCQATPTPEIINGFTYGEIVICFFLIIFSMAFIFSFLFKNFIKNI